jgi:DNA-binding protein H-NS
MKVNKFDFSNFSVDEIDAAIAELQKLRADKVEQRRAEIVEELQRLGGELERLVGPEKPKKKYAPLFKDEKGNSWTGRGALPVWLREIEAAGGSREDYRIKKS